MTEEKDKFAVLFEKIKEYITLQSQVAMLSAGERVSKVLAVLIANGIPILLCIFFLFFGSLAAAFALGEWLGSTAWGFFIIAIFFLLIFVIILILKNKYIKEPLVNVFLKLFSKMIVKNNLNSINTIADLHAEKKRLQIQVAKVEKELRYEFDKINNEISPLVNVFKLEKSATIPLLGKAAGLLLPFIISKFTNRKKLNAKRNNNSKWISLASLALGYLSDKEKLSQVSNTVTNVINKFKP